MAHRSQIEVIITPEGEMKITTHGLSGAQCLEETASMEKAVGTVKSRTKTSDFYKQAVNTISNILKK